MEKKNVGCECDPAKRINGVNCDVKNCAYHSGINDCNAGSIYVGPREASCSANTNCATFKPKSC